MANGTAVRLPLAGEPPAAPADATSKPIEVEIGEATGLCQGVAEHQNGGLRPETRLANGARIARIYHLQRAHADKLDFPAVARAEGVRALRQYLDASFYERYGPGAGDWTTNMIVDEVLVVVGRVTALEAAWAN